jgi:hypothetical protein
MNEHFQSLTRFLVTHEQYTPGIQGNIPLEFRAIYPWNSEYTPGIQGNIPLEFRVT